MSFRELDVVVRTGYTCPIGQKTILPVLKVGHFMCIQNTFTFKDIFLYGQFLQLFHFTHYFKHSKFGQELQVTLGRVHNITTRNTEIAHIFSVGVTKQSESDLDQFLIFKVRKKLLCLITVGKPILLFILVTCFGCNTMSMTDLDEYHLQIPLGTKSIDDFIFEYEANSYFQDYHCVT